MGKTDFVILWVDGADPEWLAEKSKYDGNSQGASSHASRFRDWGNLRYWFRGVEKYAPWVNSICFVTWGHVPAWLNVGHPLLRVIRHRDFIPEEYLPTFNSNAIELNLHRIEGLSEQFVLFNDDTFIINKAPETDFFLNGKICDEFVMNPIIPRYDMPIIGHTSVNNVAVINKYFRKKEVIREMPFHVFNPKYGGGLFRNVMLSPWPQFMGFYNPHIPLAHLKSTFNEIWEKERGLLDDTCKNRFRKYNDLNHWLMRYWNLCSGRFQPRKSGFGKMFTIGGDNSRLLSYIKQQKGKMVCVNDYSGIFDFEKAVKEVNGALESILPEKSSFELCGRGKEVCGISNYSGV